MDLTQNKLTKKEWMSIEVPVSANEKEILVLIDNGFHNLNIRTNKHSSLLSLMKIDYSPETEIFIYTRYFESNIDEIAKKMQIHFTISQSSKIKRPRKIEVMRMDHMDVMIKNNTKDVFEYRLLELCSTNMSNVCTATPSLNALMDIYTLNHLLKSTVDLVNKYVSDFCRTVIQRSLSGLTSAVPSIFYNAYDMIEKNKLLLQYSDLSL